MGKLNILFHPQADTPPQAAWHCTRMVGEVPAGSEPSAQSCPPRVWPRPAGQPYNQAAAGRARTGLRGRAGQGGVDVGRQRRAPRGARRCGRRSRALLVRGSPRRKKDGRGHGGGGSMVFPAPREHVVRRLPAPVASGLALGLHGRLAWGGRVLRRAPCQELGRCRAVLLGLDTCHWTGYGGTTRGDVGKGLGERRLGES
ncbi:hypothetical protein NKDENANG_02061 [Candidatus Entotheonellaceae bacterium PAL068K]